ncbi:MAG: 3-phosphoshikimate 1-carboxyvinyltransferase [Coriobacteriales bacterium]|nr:3-phosphoshikimate 1-carboxyvinyltransferase [Coriobacteriales bacterium]
MTTRPPREATGSQRPLKGSIRVPSDKSLSHRVALFSALAQGRSRVRGLLDSLDVRSTLGAIEALGAQLDIKVEADGLCGTITGWGDAGPHGPKNALQCGNSGTTSRLLLGVLSGLDVTASLEGDESLSRRPMDRVIAPLTKMGARFYPSEAFSQEGAPAHTPEGAPASTLPLTVKGTSSLEAIAYQSPVASAQVKSAVLLAGLNARGTTSVTEPYKSRDHTELLLPAYGASLTVEGLTTSITGGQRLFATDCEVPADPSSAAFLLVAAALIPQSEVTVRDVLLNPTRVGFLTVLRRMGADIAIKINKNAHLGTEQVGEVTLRYREELEATTVEPYEVPALIDEVSILALAATVAKGTTIFKQVGELRVKESDRLNAIVCGLTALGCDVREEDDDLRVSCAPPHIRATRLATHGDHRLAMTWSIAARAFALALDIYGLESIEVSYPGFFDDLKRLS